MSNFKLLFKNWLRNITLTRLIYCYLVKIQSHLTLARFKSIDNIKVLNFGSFDPPSLEKPTAQLCTFEQLSSGVYKNWCTEIKTCPRLARKHWEFVYIAQVLKTFDMLQPTKIGIGFGCGREPLPGLFAKYGCNIVATDLQHEDALTAGWTTTLEHSSSLDELYTESKLIIDVHEFKERVSFCNVNMNHISNNFDNKFNFVWSACALEHLGSLEHGIRFIKNSLKCLKEGGIAVHTTEFNLSSDDDTVESVGLSVYRKQDIQFLFNSLAQEGYEVSYLNLHTGEKQADNYIDLPPYKTSPHIKLQLENFIVTSIGFYIRKPFQVSKQA